MDRPELTQVSQGSLVLLLPLVMRNHLLQLEPTHDLFDLSLAPLSSQEVRHLSLYLQVSTV